MFLSEAHCKSVYLHLLNAFNDVEMNYNESKSNERDTYDFNAMTRLTGLSKLILSFPLEKWSSIRLERTEKRPKNQLDCDTDKRSS